MVSHLCVCACASTCMKEVASMFSRPQYTKNRVVYMCTCSLLKTMKWEGIKTCLVHSMDIVEREIEKF